MEKIFWFALLVVFIIAEAATVSTVSVWFALGSLAALVISLIGGELWLQILVFLTVSTVALALLRPIARKYFNSRITRTNVDAIAGKTCLCVTPIDNLNGVGQVKLGDVEWSARSTNGDPIPAGTQVTIDRVEGVKVFVTPVKVTVS